MMRSMSAWVAAALCGAAAACGGGGGGGEPQSVQNPVPMPDPTPVDYPVALWDSRVEGETEVLVLVNERGNVDSVRVGQSSGHVEFDSAAVEGARHLRFTPGRRGDRPAAMWTIIPIRFARDSTASLGAARGAGTRP
jgi:periplasmic protein TonB